MRETTATRRGILGGDGDMHRVGAVGDGLDRRAPFLLASRRRHDGAQRSRRAIHGLLIYTYPPGGTLCLLLHSHTPRLAHARARTFHGRPLVTASHQQRAGLAPHSHRQRRQRPRRVPLRGARRRARLGHRLLGRPIAAAHAPHRAEKEELLRPPPRLQTRRPCAECTRDAVACEHAARMYDHRMSSRPFYDATMTSCPYGRSLCLPMDLHDKQTMNHCIIVAIRGTPQLKNGIGPFVH